MQDAVELNVISPSTGRGPVTTGLPWPRGKLLDPHKLVLRDASDKVVRLQARATDRWPDGSVRWVLLDWIAEANAGPYRVAVGDPVAVEGPVVKAEVRDGAVTVDTGAARFELGGGPFPFGRIVIGGLVGLDPNTGGMTATDDDGAGYRPAVDRTEIEEAGDVRVCVCVRGHVSYSTPPPGKEDEENYFGKLGERQIAFDARLHFSAGSAAVRFEFTLRNRRPRGTPAGCGTWATRVRPTSRTCRSRSRSRSAGVAFAARPKSARRTRSSRRRSNWTRIRAAGRTGAAPTT